VIARISGFFLYIFSELVFRSCRFYIVGYDEAVETTTQKEPVILTSWHGMTMMVAAFIRKNFDVRTFTVITPDDYRGDVLKEFARHLGVDTIAMNLDNDSTMGIGRKLVELIRQISSGKNFIIHPDGPAGPAYKVKPGLSYIAKKTGTKILPMGCYCRNAYHVPRWDRYTLPLPFSKVHIQLGPLMLVPEDLNDLSEYNHHLEDILNKLTFQAAANYYELES
jgi:lysophospholipid acyltransferase (LPLAT)-like uncharacterized protein